MSSVDFHKNFFRHDESISFDFSHDIVDISSFVQNICEVETVCVDEPSFLESISKGESDEGDELVRLPGGVVSKLLLLESKVRTPVRG